MLRSVALPAAPLHSWPPEPAPEEQWVTLGLKPTAVEHQCEGVMSTELLKSHPEGRTCLDFLLGCCLQGTPAAPAPMSGAVGSTDGSAGLPGWHSPVCGIINSLLIICRVNHQWPGVNHAYEMNPAPALMSAES